MTRQPKGITSKILRQRIRQSNLINFLVTSFRSWAYALGTATYPSTIHNLMANERP
jgi:hypothetical protein